ncbi:hypothetical protein BUALT_Bualt19G0068800 [Buddleja alternifolia]|uniref:PHD and RING finger domain-containing protein 1 n=1 Tax=Buddleja alternifolia TaxID=168488 RepID=A0AAV6W1P4_9LAMI|nr:hypothetical protein BUALT_Bualt19G0068800 [Buddleja alternifolia]
MARGGKISYKRKTRTKVQLKKKGSDESDEDYTVSDSESFNESEDEYCSSLADDESEESFGEFVEEKGFMKKKIKKVLRPRVRKGLQGKKNNEFVKTRKKNATYSEEDGVNYDDDDFSGAKRRRRSLVAHKKKEGDDIELLYRQEEDGFGDDERRKKAQFLSTKRYADCSNEKARKKARVSYREGKEDGDYYVSDDDDDEEFTPDEIDGLDDDEEFAPDEVDGPDDDEESAPDEVDGPDDDEEFSPDEVDGSDDDEEFAPDEVDGLEDEEELPVSKKSKVSRLRVQKTMIANGRKRKKNAKALKRTRRKKPIKKQGLRRKNRPSHGNEFTHESRILQKKKKVTGRGRRRRKQSVSDSDSDFVSPGSFNYEYTVSEEEREQVKEAGEFCKRLTTSLRSSSSLKMIEDEEIVPPQRKRQVRKGKEKVLDMKVEVGKQVCGICLSEEGKKTVRGILNCCSHYFCFACIMEWSKVESRCPLCKQRFATISRNARTDGIHDLRDAVITVPERDQIYQPSEEELRGYLDPYENFFCTECQQGGDDSFMLLCDLCDSPAHTYCVGLGRAVPEGNWYCDGCRPTALASSNAQALNPTPDNGFNNNFSVSSSPVATPRMTFDLNELYVPETPSSQVTVHAPSPRQSIGDSVSGAFTLYERRRIQRQIHQLLNNRSRQSERSDGVGPVSRTSLFASQIVEDGAIEPQNIYSQGRLPNYTTTPSLYNEVLSPRLSSLRGQVADHQASTSMDHSFGEISHSGINERIGHGLGPQQLRSCNSRSNTGADSISQYQSR